jgi:hypothetical protein
MHLLHKLNLLLEQKTLGNIASESKKRSREQFEAE